MAPPGQPAFILYVQTFGDRVTYSPHIHALVADGVFLPSGTFRLLPPVSEQALCQTLRLLLNHVPDKYEHLGSAHGWYFNRSRGARRLAQQAHDTSASIVIDEPAADARRKANWARL